MQAVYSLWSSMSAPLTSEEYWPFSTSSDIARSVRHTNGDFLHDGIAAADTVCAISARAVSQQAKGRPSQSRVPKPYRAIRGVATHERPSAPENPFKTLLRPPLPSPHTPPTHDHEGCSETSSPEASGFTLSHSRGMQPRQATAHSQYSSAHRMQANLSSAPGHLPLTRRDLPPLAPPRGADRVSKCLLLRQLPMQRGTSTHQQGDHRELHSG